MNKNVLLYDIVQNYKNVQKGAMMDRRQQKTRTAVFQAFTSLLSHKRYSDITVQDIINEANIGRSTFYAHFETKDLLLEALCDDLFQHIFHRTPTDCNIPCGHRGEDPAHDAVVHILHHLTHRGEAFIRLLRTDSADLFLHYFKTHLERHLTLSYPNTALPEDYLRNHFVISFVGTVHWWIRNGMQESPDDITHYFFSVMPAPLSQITPDRT